MATEHYLIGEYAEYLTQTLIALTGKKVEVLVAEVDLAARPLKIPAASVDTKSGVLTVVYRLNQVWFRALHDVVADAVLLVRGPGAWTSEERAVLQVRTAFYPSPLALDRCPDLQRAQSRCPLRPTVLEAMPEGPRRPVYPNGVGRGRPLDPLTYRPWVFVSDVERDLAARLFWRRDPEDYDPNKAETLFANLRTEVGHWAQFKV